MLKRYEDHELGESASRRVGYHCTTDYAKSSRSNCHVCETNIEKNELRLALMLQDDEGYKSKAWTHFDCFWKHPETRKLNGTDEIHDFGKLKPSDRKRISTAFDSFNAKKSTSKKKRKLKSDNDDDDSDDESHITKQKSTTKKTTKKKPITNKRKRTLEEK